MSNSTLRTLAIFLFLSMAFTEGANASSQPGEQKTSAKDALEVPAGYVIGPEDVLAVTVWKEPDFSGQVAVRPDGKISLPLINDIQASGLKPVELSSELVEKLKTYVTDPRVTVTVTSINSQRFYALGEVVRQGAFTLQPNMTVLQGLSTAGGLSEFAASKKIYVLRMESGKQVKLPFNYKEVLRGRNSEQNVVLKKGDTIVVP